MKIKFTDLYKLVKKKKKILNRINSLIKNNQFIGGKEVVKFETAFAHFTGAKYMVSLGNGTDALEIAIKSLNLHKDNEVIVPVNTWISTVEAIITNNLKVVFCDVNLEDYTLCIKDLKKKINKNTRLIIPVHLYGNPSDMNEIKKIIKNKKIKIIEDCAQAHGTMINNKHVGTFGEIGTFSFFPSKNLGCFGDGGGIITNNKKIYNYIIRTRNHGALGKYDHKFSGRNSRLDSIQAAVLNIKLKDYKNVVKTRNALAQIYFKRLNNISDLHMYNLKQKNLYSFHQFVIRVNNNRDKLQKFLKKHNIETMIHYPYMLNELKFFNQENKKLLTNSLNLGKKILSLPISEEHSKQQIYYVIKKIKKFYKNS